MPPLIGAGKFPGEPEIFPFVDAGPIVGNAGAAVAQSRGAMWYSSTVSNLAPGAVRARRWPFIVAIVLALGVVVSVEQRGSESELSAAVERLATAQQTLAQALAMGLERELINPVTSTADAVTRFRADAHRVAPEQLILVDSGDGLRDAKGETRRRPYRNPRRHVLPRKGP